MRAPPGRRRQTATGAGVLMLALCASGTAVAQQPARLAGRVQRARERIAGRASPTVYDLPHALTLFGSAPVAGGVRLNVVFQARSGPVQTPVAARTFTGIPGEWLSPRYLAGDRNSFRLPPYRRLDVGLRRRWRPGGAEITGSLQVLNILGRTNALEYDWPTILCAAQGRCTRESGITRRGLPILPTVGIEVRW